jgi:hypothetical protein
MNVLSISMGIGYPFIDECCCPTAASRNSKAKIKNINSLFNPWININKAYWLCVPMGYLGSTGKCINNWL